MTPAELLALGISSSIVLMVLGLGLRSGWGDALYLFRHPALLLRSLLSMNVVMPLVAVALVVIFDLPVSVKIALVALAVSPVPPLLPRKELKAGADASYAVGLCVAVAALSIIIVPIAISWLGSAFHRSGEIAAAKVAKTALSSVLVPLAVGIVVRQLSPVWAHKLARPLALVGMVLLVVCVLPLAYALWPKIQALIGDGTALIVALMAAIGLGVGHALGPPGEDERTVLALSTSSRHPAIALAAGNAVSSDVQPVLAAIVLYVIVAALVSFVYLWWRRRHAQATAPSMRFVK